MPRMLNRRERRRLERKLAWTVARQAWMENPGDPNAAKATAERLLKAREARPVSISPATILLLIRIAFMLIDWWYANGVSAPSEEPGDGDIEAVQASMQLPQVTADSQPKSMWGESPKRRKVRGSYEASDYSPKGKFGPRDAGSVFENTAILMPVITATSYQIETLAAKSVPGLPTGVAGVSSWLFQVAVWFGLKVLANAMRSYGASLLRDFGAWVWSQFFEGLWSGVKDSLRSLWPFGRRRRLIDHKGEETDSPHKRRRLIDLLFPPRGRRR